MLKLITAATESPVSLDDAATHCRSNSDDADALEVYLATAVAFVADRLNLVLAPSVYRVDRCDWWSGCLEILVAPVRDIASVKYFDEAGDQQTVDPEFYRWTRTEDGSARLELLSTFTPPAVEADRNDAIRIEVDAGFDIDGVTGSGDDPELTLPQQARLAILMLTEHWFNNRSAVAADDLKNVPTAAEALMAQVRVYR